MLYGNLTGDGVRRAAKTTGIVLGPSPRDPVFASGIRTSHESQRPVAESMADTNGRASAGLTHEEIRGLLPRYAAGTLSFAEAEDVRTHLATGCADCLGAFYRMPVGMPRTVEPPASIHTGSDGPVDPLPIELIPPPEGPASGAPPSWSARVVGLAVAVALIAWIFTLWRR